MKNIWQRARTFFKRGEEQRTTPALTPEGASLGYEWEVEKGKLEAAVLWPRGREALETGPVTIAHKDPHSLAEWSAQGTHETFSTRAEAMGVAENIATDSAIGSLSGASESFYATLSARTDSRGTDAGRDAGRSFGVDL